MRTALTIVLITLAAACGGTDDDPETATTASPPGIEDVGIDAELIGNDPNAPCAGECPDGSWCSYGRCVMP